jgi:hypothetical protein
VVRRNDAAALSAAELARDRGEAKLHDVIQALRRAGYQPARVTTPRTTVKPVPATPPPSAVKPRSPTVRPYKAPVKPYRAPVKKRPATSPPGGTDVSGGD